MDDGVFVTNIKATTDQVALRSFFGQFGTVTDLNLQPDKFNEANKVCYIRFSTPEGAAKCVKGGDRSTHFGEPLKIALKKFTERAPRPSVEHKVVEPRNEVNRVQSFGRGRGSIIHSPVAPSFVNEVVHLQDLSLPLKMKFVVEIIELKSLVNMLVRPLKLTEDLRLNLYSILEKHNANANRLCPVKSPEIGGFYLAKWMEDNNFYRAKILNKISEGKFEVCFVDEGTTGDIVSELRAIPDDLSDIPCQYLSCTANCHDSQELIDLVLKEGGDKVVSVCTLSPKKVNDKTVISIFIDDKNIIDLYKAKYSTDPRLVKVPCHTDMKKHKVDEQFSNCQIIKIDSEKSGNVIITLKQSTTLACKSQGLDTCPLINDLLVFKDNSGNWCRCIVQGYKFDNDIMSYTVSLVDENKEVNVVRENLMKCGVDEINFPSSIVNAVIDGGNMPSYNDIDNVKISDFDARKNLYSVKIIENKKIAPIVTGTNGSLAGQTLSAIVSHVESVNEFYIQRSDEASMMSLDKIQIEINNECYKIVKLNNAREIKIGQVVIAPFQESNYRATVREIESSKNECLCYFMDFGNSEWVSTNQLSKAQDNVAHKEPMAQRCRLSVTIKQEKIKEATEMLLDYCERGEIEVQIKVTDSDKDVLVVNVTADKKSSFVDILHLKEFIGVSTVITKATVIDEAKIKELLLKKIADLEQRIAKLEMRNGCK